MALGTFPFKSQKKAQGNVGEVLNFGNVKFQKGYFLFADIDGVIVKEKSEI